MLIYFEKCKKVGGSNLYYKAVGIWDGNHDIQAI